VWVKIVENEKTEVVVSVRDEGVGIPGDIDPAKSKKLGTRLVTALASQLQAELTKPPQEKGTRFELLIPLDPSG
jgi:two-component sensor histidine kinase